jgi:L-tyrosine isonitrile synthase
MMQRRVDQARHCRPNDKHTKHTQPSAHDVVTTFNTWHFKREQPADITLLTQTVDTAMNRGAPIPFVLYWGKGHRIALADPDLQCMDFLQELVARIAAIYPAGASLTLILTDTHADLNGFPTISTNQYFTNIHTEALTRGFRTILLSEVVRRAAGTNYKNCDKPIPSDLLDALVASAQKWYAGGLSARDGAIAYYRQNMIEKQAVQDEFTDAVFITFNGRSQRLLFPTDLPIFFMYSLRRGVAVKPWFMSSESGEHQTASHAQ